MSPTFGRCYVPTGAMHGIQLEFRRVRPERFTIAPTQA